MQGSGKGNHATHAGLLYRGNSGRKQQAKKYELRGHSLHKVTGRWSADVRQFHIDAVVPTASRRPAMLLQPHPGSSGSAELIECDDNSQE